MRWDRLGRIALLMLFVGVLCLYIGPARSYFSTWHESKAQHARVAQLRAEHERLVAQYKALHTRSAVVRRAREMGMVRPGERAYVVSGLPSG